MRSVIILILSLIPSLIIACSCDNPTIEKALKQSDISIVAEILKIEKAAHNELRITAFVKNTYKRYIYSDTLYFLTPVPTSGACAIPFYEGNTYIINAKEHNTPSDEIPELYYTDLCFLSQSYSEETENQIKQILANEWNAKKNELEKKYALSFNSYYILEKEDDRDNGFFLKSLKSDCNKKINIATSIQSVFLKDSLEWQKSISVDIYHYSSQQKVAQNKSILNSLIKRLNTFPLPYNYCTDPKFLLGHSIIYLPKDIIVFHYDYKNRPSSFLNDYINVLNKKSNNQATLIHCIQIK